MTGDRGRGIDKTGARRCRDTIDIIDTLIHLYKYWTDYTYGWRTSYEVLGVRAEEQMTMRIIIKIGLDDTMDGPKEKKGEKEDREGHHGEGGGGRGRIRLDCELKPGLVGGVQGRGRLSWENCFTGTTGRL